MRIPNLKNSHIGVLQHHMLLHCSRHLQHSMMLMLFHCSQNPHHLWILTGILQKQRKTIRWSCCCVLESPKGYWKVISHDGEEECEVTDCQKWLIHLKSQYLYSALHIAKEKMPTIQNWDELYHLDREIMSLTGVRTGRYSRMIQNLYLDFTEIEYLMYESHQSTTSLHFWMKIEMKFRK